MMADNSEKKTGAGRVKPKNTSSGNTLTKADLIDAIHGKLGGAKKEAQDVVEMIFDTMKDKMASGEKIKISGFGNFVVRDKRARTGRNPQTGEAITISARRVLTFKPSQILKAEVNGEEVSASDRAADAREN
jgi:integration host factor subunit alpha